MSYTLGPWIVAGDPVAILNSRRDLTIALLFKGMKGDDIVLANARLIAAAPDLLEACKATDAAFIKLERWQTLTDVEPSLKEALTTAWRQVHEAIQKAEGVA